MNGEDTKFKKGNKAASKSPKVVLRKFNEILYNAKNDNRILSWQAACLSIGWRVTKCDYWAEKISVFGNIKKEVMQIIISRINNGVLLSDYNPTGGIWRMKQCGEKDEKTVDNKSSDGSMRHVQLSQEAARAISNKFDDEV